MSERVPEGEGQGRANGAKGPQAFRTISEVAEELDLPQHVLRFWETRFPQIKPLKRGGGRRYYRPDDVELLKGIRELLYGQGYTIKGVQRILRQDGYRAVQAMGRGEADAVAHGFDDPAPAATAEEDEGSGEARPENREGPPPGETASAEAGEAAPTLSEADIGLLRSALVELRECQRVLAALRPAADREAEEGG